MLPFLVLCLCQVVYLEKQTYYLSQGKKTGLLFTIGQKLIYSICQFVY